MSTEARKRLRDDPVFFTKLVMGWMPFPYQEKLLRAKNKRIAALWGRQSGKTTTIAMKTIHFIYTHPGVTVLIVSKGLRQSMIMFGVIANMIMSTPILKHSIIRYTRTQIELKNRSMVVALPCSQSGFNLRGFTADMVVMDEAAFMPESVITSVIFPMLACVAEGTPIQMSDGRILPIEHTAGGALMTVDDEYDSASETPEKLVNVGRCEGVKIILKGGHEIVVTRDTKLPTRQGWKIVSVGDKVLVPWKIYASGTTDVEPWIPKFLGLMIADGCMTGTQALWSKKAGSALVDEMNSIIQPGYWLRPTGHNQFTISQTDEHFENLYIQTLKEYCLWGQHSRDKVIPDEVFTWRNEHVKSFLWAFLSSDSSVGSRGIAFENNNRKLVDQVRSLLLRFGVYSSLYTTSRKSHKLSITGQNAARLLAEIGIAGKDTPKIKVPRRSYQTFGSLREQPVLKIEPVGKVHFYDFVMPNTHSYIANNLWVHNTTEKARGTGIAIMISTPWGREHIFYRCYTNPEWFTQHVKSADCPLITEGYLKEMRGLIGELRFDTEYNAIFREDATALFTQDMIRGAIEDEFYDARVTKNLLQLITDNELLAYDGQFTGEHCMGIDIGKRRDYTVVSIFRKSKRTVSKELWRVIGETKEKQGEPDVEVIDPAWSLVYLKVFPLGTLLTDAVKHCIWLTKKFAINVAYIDQTQVGEMPFEVIRANFPQLKGAYLTAQEKQNVMMSLYLMIEERRVGIPYGEEYKEILAQMAEQQYGYSQVRQTRETEELGERGVMTFWHPDSRHDDILWSVALAIYGVAQEAGYRSWRPPSR